MNYPTLKRGASGKNVVSLQSKLNKVGCMLTPDGDFGGGTERAISYAQKLAKQPQSGIADPALWKWLDKQKDPSSLLDTDGVAFIAKEETGGLSYYNQVTRWPHFPGHASGITIGVGYDLRFNTAADFKRSWKDHLPNSLIKELLKDIGIKGSKKRAQELKDKGFEVEFFAAWSVLVGLTLPRYYKMTESIYPSLGQLPESCRSCLVSLVFNRGSKISGKGREEMKNIQSILVRCEDPTLTKVKRRQILTEVEDELISMKRLWNASSGLIKRREAEAALWRKGVASI